MKSKMILPLLAVVFAAFAAFANLPVQRAWSKSAMGVVSEGDITTPSSTSGITCTLSGANVCKVSGRDAYDSQAHAQAGGDEGKYFYNPL